jgi:hypothetical protein
MTFYSCFSASAFDRETAGFEDLFLFLRKKQVNTPYLLSKNKRCPSALVSAVATGAMAGSLLE